MQTLNLENDALRVEICKKTGAFISICNKSAGLELVSAPGTPRAPWELRVGVTGEDGDRIDTIDKAESFSADPCPNYPTGEAYELRWILASGQAVEARLELPPGEEPLRLYPAVIDGVPDIMVLSLRYPIIRGIGRLVDEPAENLLAHPMGSGFLYEDPFTMFQEHTIRGIHRCQYPNGFGPCMQFMAYYAEERGGFYLACEDPHDTVKEVDFYAPEGQESLETAFGHFSWDVHLGNDLRLGYPVVIAALNDGDWYEAAELYRQWATGSGPGHPTWCRKGLLEDRVANDEASKWLAEEVGYCTFGMPSSVDISPWLEAFHEAAGGPVFHVFGHDWPAWAEDPLRHGKAAMACKAVGLAPMNTLVPRTPRIYEKAFRDAKKAAEGKSGERAVKAFMTALCEGCEVEPMVDYPMDAARLLLEEADWLVAHYDLEVADKPLPWSPSVMNKKNIETLRRLGDHYALFEFDSFPYGHDRKHHGLNTKRAGVLGFTPEENNEFAQRWTDPGYEPWVRFHARRDADATRDTGADADYYDVSSAAVPQSLFSNRTDRLDRPVGWGRTIVQQHRDNYERTKAATREASGGKYVPQGSEVMAEVYMGEMDYAQCRAGGGVQGDMEGTQFMPYIKTGQARRIPLFSYVYHAYGCVKIDGWAKIAPEFGEIFYLIAAQVTLEGGLLELNYEFSPIELFPGMEPPSYQLHYFAWVETVDDPKETDPAKVQFLNEISQARTGFAKDFLAYGEMIRPAAVSSTWPALSFDWKHYNSIIQRREEGEFEGPSVVHHGWSYRGKRLGYIFCNLAPDPQHAEITIDLFGTPLEGKKASVTRVTRGERENIGSVDKGIATFSEELPARKIVLYEVEETA